MDLTEAGPAVVGLSGMASTDSARNDGAFGRHSSDGSLKQPRLATSSEQLLDKLKPGWTRLRMGMFRPVDIVSAQISKL